MLDRGIYRIKHIPSGKLYIGSAVSLKRRWRSHKGSLRRGDHGNPRLQMAYNKYGIENFEFRIMRYVEDKKDLIRIEQFYLDMYKPFYNICKIAGSTLGVRGQIPWNKGKKGAQVAWNKGMPTPKEAREKQSRAHMGKKLSEEHRAKIGLKSLGNKYNLGRILTEEHKEKISIANKGTSHSGHYKKGYESLRKRPVLKFSKNGVFIKKYPSIKDAEKEIGKTNVSLACIETWRTAGGYKWQYANQHIPPTK